MRNAQCLVMLFPAALLFTACDNEETAPQVPCETDRDCQDGDLCNGAEQCLDEICQAGQPASCPVVGGWACEACAEDERCLTGFAGFAPEPVPRCEPVCLLPPLPHLEVLPVGARIPVPDGVVLSVAGAPVEGELVLESVGTLHLEARWRDASDCGEAWRAELEVVEAITTDPATASDAIAADDPRIVGWAEGFRDYEPGTDLDPVWKDPRKALGPALGVWHDAVSLGNGGRLTMVFGRPITDGPGPDLAVFENGFNEAFLELALVEVSSNGVDFARFPAWSGQVAPVGPYGTLEPAEVLGLAGRYRVRIGQAFDLATLRTSEAVQTGRVDLHAIHFVRVIDVVGDGSTRDAFGHPIYDPTPTWGPAGFDLEAIGALHLAP